MLLRGRLGDSLYSLSLQADWLTVGVDEQLVVSWDRGGRLYTLYRGEHTFRRGLNGRVLEKWQDSGGTRHRDHLDHGEVAALVDDACHLAARLLEALGSPRWAWLSRPDQELVDEVAGALTAAARFNSTRAREDAAKFHQIYTPIGILPPDQYLALVVQATDGCSFNTCTFCDLYGGRYRVKTHTEFEHHLGALHEWLGPSMGLRGRGIFIGSANALAVPMATLVPMFEAVARVFGHPRGGIAAFVDGFTGTKKTAGDYHHLAALGLRRVYIGLESGHDPLLRFVQKPATCADVEDTVAAIKAAGIHVGVIVMIGLGGHRYAERHVDDTVRLLNRLALGSGDLLYFSDLVEVPAAPYPRMAAGEVIRPLDAAGRALQRQAIREQLAFDGEAPKMATYDVREFVY